ncbi:methyltransferase domain-containing protein [Agrococcus sp. 1P02AA]|uniref:class I SAM-dependent methyltransferase n=1 Tax=Agrococcus sp. 1P02AA TaxID=3132259 RepID=UPI0039A74725
MADDMRATWDREAETFDEAADHGLRDPAVRRAWAELLLPVLGTAARRVADLGCGTGTLSTLLAVEGGHQVHGIDLSPEMIRRARRKASDVLPRPVFTVADAAHPPLPAGSFDAVLCRHVLWAMPDPLEALRTWVELLAPGGVLVLVEGRWSNDVGLSAAESSKLLGQVRETHELTMLQDPALWGRRIDDERYLLVSRR